MRAEVAEYKLIAIGRRLRHAVGADRSTRPSNVLHHHLLIKDLTQPRGQKPSDHVERAACGERDDHRNRTRRPFLRTGGRDWITSVAKATMILMLGIDVPSDSIKGPHRSRSIDSAADQPWSHKIGPRHVPAG